MSESKYIEEIKTAFNNMDMSGDDNMSSDYDAPFDTIEYYTSCFGEVTESGEEITPLYVSNRLKRLQEILREIKLGILTPYLEQIDIDCYQLQKDTVNEHGCDVVDCYFDTRVSSLTHTIKHRNICPCCMVDIEVYPYHR